VKVGAPIAILAGEGEDVSATAPKADTAPVEAPKAAAPAPKADAIPKSAPVQAPVETPAAPAQPAAAPRAEGDRVKASPLARRLAQAQNVDLNSLQGTGPGGRIVRADIDAAVGKAPAAAPAGAPAAAAPGISTHLVVPGPMEQAIPHEAIKLSNIRKTIARRLTESKQQIPHILAARAKEGKLQPQEYQGGTASLSNMGMYGIKQFEAVINPPQGMIMAIGAGEKRPYVINDSLQIASVMSATGSFDHRAIDGADGAKLMQAFKRLVENPLGMLA